MRSQKIEQWLKSEGVDFIYQDKVSMDAVDFETSKQNQARFIPLDQDAVVELAAAYSAGAAFDAMIAYTKKDKLVFIDGVHRFMALQTVGGAEFDCYVVKTVDEWVIRRLTFRANLVLNGRPPTREERLQHAVYLIENDGIGVNDAAKLFSLNSSVVSSAVNGVRARKRLAKMKFTEDLDSAKFQTLNRIKQDKPLLKAAKLVHGAQLTQAEVHDFVAEIVDAASTPEQQDSVLVKWNKMYQDRIAATQNGKIKWENKKSVNELLAIHMRGIIRYAENEDHDTKPLVLLARETINVLKKHYA